MPKSKNNRKGKPRKKVYRTQQKEPKGWDGKGGYTKTDGQSNTCYYDKNHNLKRIEPHVPPESEEFGLETVWTIGSTVAGKTIREIIDWHPPYLDYWIKQGIKLTEGATNYLNLKISEK